MKIKSGLLFLAAFFLFSCAGANLSKNTVETGKLYIKDGTFADKTWNENLTFERYSWFHELTLNFDFLLAPVIPQSSFNFWFSKDELDALIKCADFRIALAYSLDTKEIPYSSLYEQIDRAGLTRIDLLEFKKHLLGHPDAQQFGLRLYKVFGICKPNKDLKPLIINFPGYSEKLIN